MSPLGSLGDRIRGTLGDIDLGPVSLQCVHEFRTLWLPEGQVLPKSSLLEVGCSLRLTCLKMFGPKFLITEELLIPCGSSVDIYHRSSGVSERYCSHTPLTIFTLQ